MLRSVQICEWKKVMRTLIGGDNDLSTLGQVFSVFAEKGEKKRRRGSIQFGTNLVIASKKEKKRGAEEDREEEEEKSWQRPRRLGEELLFTRSVHIGTDMVKLFAQEEKVEKEEEEKNRWWRRRGRKKWWQRWRRGGRGEGVVEEEKRRKRSKCKLLR